MQSFDFVGGVGGGGSYLMTPRESGGMPPFKNRGSDITFPAFWKHILVKILYFKNNNFLGAFCDKSHKHTNLIQHFLPVHQTA